MADLESFAVNVNAIRNGAWDAPGPEWGDMELLVRGFGPHYSEPLAKAQQAAVRKARMDGTLKARQDWEDLPLSDRNALNDEMMLKHIFINVRNLKFGGEEVSAEKYRQLAQDPRFRDRLMTAVYVSAENVTNTKAARKEEAEGNSSMPSDTN